MELSFTYTFADFKEAVAVIRKPPASERGSKWEPRLAVLTTVGLMLALLVVAALASPVLPSGDIRETFLSRFAIMLVPCVMIVGFIWAVFIPKIAASSRRGLRVSLLIVALAFVLSTFIGAMYPEPPPAPDAPQPGPLLAILRWLILLLGVLVVLIRIVRGSIQTAWESQPHLRLPHTAKFSAENAEIANPNERNIYQWPAFVWFRETANLFILQPSRLTFHIIPKRACRDASEVDSLRRILEQHVRNADPQPLGFAVIAPPLKVIESVSPES